ncbi:class F sortase [Curtobacterium sp. Leaf261]|uniref:class F sortase n=1 Tax=Curtobacterium sp. Leaf261 TaxID=1736311 RepID=UPI0006FEC254|nr:class F sortase [Curtobacterium sp. Leaf261]
MIRLPKWGWVTIAAAVVVVGGGAGLTAAVAIGREAPRASVSQPASDATSTDEPSSSSSAAPRGNNAADGPQDPTANETSSTAADAVPVSVHIPSIHVDANLEDLHKDAAGALEPPTEWNDAGWYSDGVVPGHVGPAIIAGHVDSLTSAAIFYDLDELAAGDAVTVSMSDGTTLSFTVRSSQQAAKNAFPTSNVYGTTPTPELRLITCGGTFDKTAGHYTDNLIVFADLNTA